MFSLPADGISQIINYASAFFNDVKIYIFLALGVAVGMLIIGYLFTIVPAQAYQRDVRREAGKRLAEADEEGDDFESDVGEAMSEELYAGEKEWSVEDIIEWESQ